MTTAGDGLSSIRRLDYTVLYVRDMEAMRAFYCGVMCFPIRRELGPDWLELEVGANVLALARPHLTAQDPTAPSGAAVVQLAFRVGRTEVAMCERELVAAGVQMLAPTTDQAWGHRTLFFRDPDGNLIEIYAELASPVAA